MIETKIYLKAKLMEKPFVLSCLILFLTLTLASPAFHFRALKTSLSKTASSERMFRVPVGMNDMITVINAHKELDLAFFGNLFAVAAVTFQGSR